MRTDRERLIGVRRGLDLRDRGGPVQTQRKLVRVYDGGSIPTAVPKVYLTHPATADADDSEGASYSTSDDSGTTIPVVVIGPNVPVAGDLLVAHAIGGRWLAQQGGGTTPTYSCSPCAIPEKDLTVCWYNSLSGNGSTTLVYNSGSHQWTSACSNQLIYSLSCPTGTINFSVKYFLTGTCPSGQSQSCTYPGVTPLRLVLNSYTCSDPFMLDFRTASGGFTCTTLGDDGYTRFVVTDGSCP